MTQPPVPGRGAGEEPGRDARLPGSRDPRLDAFTQGSARDRCLPGAQAGMVLDELSGPGRRYADVASDDELIGLLGRWNAQESWTVAAKFGVIRELIRRRAIPGKQAQLPCGLPEVWDETVDHEVSAELGISPQAADRLINLAWTLEARIPRIGAALEAGIIDYVKG